MITSDLSKRYWVVTVGTLAKPFGRFAYVWRSYMTLKGCQKWTSPETTPVKWEDLDWEAQTRQIVINARFLPLEERL